MAAKTINVGKAERIGSAIGGAALVLRALARPRTGRLMAAIAGLALLQRGLTGHSALYRQLGLDTSRLRGPRALPRPAEESDPVLCASEDSFPASDPPSWTPVAGAAGR